MQPVSCAIAGYGHIGRLCHQLILAHPDAGLRVTAVADPSLAREVREGVRFSTDVHDVLADVDAVLIATPPASHFAIARDSLASGKHVYVEKPPASTVDECEHLVGLQRVSNGILFFAFHAIYNESVERARNAMSSASIAEIEARYFENVLNWHHPSSWVHREGVLRDSGINALSVIRRLLPDGARWDVVAASLSGPEGQGETKALVRFTFGELGKGCLHMDWTHAGEEIRTISVRAGSDHLLIDISSDSLTRNGKVVVNGSAGNLLAREYERMLRHFSECIRSGESIGSCAEMRILEQIPRVSNGLGQVV